MLYSFPSFSAEKIQTFHVDATLEKDATLTVTEEISILSDGTVFQHGIYRDFPLFYQVGKDVKEPLFFHLMSIKKEGKSVPYLITLNENNYHIKIGDKDKKLSLGEHRYTLQYRLKNIISFFNDYDELYWNAIGHGWNVPIDSSSVSIRVADDLPTPSINAYTGSRGDALQHYTLSQQQDTYTITSTKNLGAYQGLTLSMTFPKGTFEQQNTLPKIFDFITFHPEWLMALLMPLFLSVVILFLWFQKGRDKKEITIPRFDIPDEITPDFLRYINQQKYDDKNLSCLLIHAAATGIIQIDIDNYETKITRIKSSTPTQANTESVIATLLNGAESITLPRTRTMIDSIDLANHQLRAQSLENALSEHRHRLAEQSVDYIHQNLSIKIGAVVFMILSCCLIWFLTRHFESMHITIVIAGVLCVSIIAAFWRALNQYTQTGRDIKRYADGLKMYLSIAEEARLNKLYPEKITPDIFEKFLPYALALDVEQEWSEYFSKQINETINYKAGDNQTAFRNHMTGVTPHNIATIMNSAIIQPIALIKNSANNLPTGSSNQGTSGGGRGGGGGGGW